MRPARQTPGVYLREERPARRRALETGVPAFLGYGDDGPVNTPARLSLPLFDEVFLRRLSSPGHLASALRGFFDNGGDHCFVVRLGGAVNDPPAARRRALADGLEALAGLDDIDLVCAPDAVAPAGTRTAAEVTELQRLMLRHCDELGDRFALLDPPSGADVVGVQAQARRLASRNGALYFPWLLPRGGTGDAYRDPAAARPAPPSGHVAGVFARTDRESGHHRAPAGAEVEGVLDLATWVDGDDLDALSAAGVNPLVARRGRGIRVWGARTLSPEPAWTHVNVRRIVLTLVRWAEQHLAGAAFEPNDPGLWHRVQRDLEAYLHGLFLAGALSGGSPAEAYFVRCDAETNPSEARERGEVVAEVGLRPAVPAEWIVLRLVQGASGVDIAEPGSA